MMTEDLADRSTNPQPALALYTHSLGDNVTSTPFFSMLFDNASQRSSVQKLPGLTRVWHLQKAKDEIFIILVVWSLSE